MPGFKRTGSVCLAIAPTTRSEGMMAEVASPSPRASTGRRQLQLDVGSAASAASQRSQGSGNPLPDRDQVRHTCITILSITPCRGCCAVQPARVYGRVDKVKHLPNALSGPRLAGCAQWGGCKHSSHWHSTYVCCDLLMMQDGVPDHLDNWFVDRGPWCWHALCSFVVLLTPLVEGGGFTLDLLTSIGLRKPALSSLFVPTPPCIMY